MEDVTSDSKDWSARKMLNDLLVRNRINAAHINTFREEESRMEAVRPIN